jgi:uncharacterized membrane protein YidH (DUF202 family)
MRADRTIGWVLILVALLAQTLVAGWGWVEVPGVAGREGRYLIHALVLLVPGLLLGVALVLLCLGAMPRSEDEPLERVNVRLAFGVAVVALGVVLVAAAGARTVEPLRAGLMIVCGIVTLALAYATMIAIDRPDGFSFETHWGGLGGGMGGWRASRAVILFMLLLVFAGATVTSALWQPGQTEEADAGSSDGENNATEEKAGESEGAEHS